MPVCPAAGRTPSPYPPPLSPSTISAWLPRNDGICPTGSVRRQNRYLAPEHLSNHARLFASIGNKRDKGNRKFHGAQYYKFLHTLGKQTVNRPLVSLSACLEQKLRCRVAASLIGSLGWWTFALLSLARGWSLLC